MMIYRTPKWMITTLADSPFLLSSVRTKIISCRTAWVLMNDHERMNDAIESNKNKINKKEKRKYVLIN